MNYAMRRLTAAWPWLVITVLTVLVTLLVMLPAAWIVPQFSKASAGHVNLVDPAGSLWHGSATLMLAAGSDGEGATLLPGRVEWRTEFWPLFTGHVRMQMRQTQAMPDAVYVDAAMRGATLSAGQIAVPASLLAGLGAPFNTLDMEGNVKLAWTEWRVLGGGSTYGQVIVTLDDMASRVSRVKPLGSYRVVFQAVGTAGTIDLNTAKGPLMLSGQGTVAGRSATFQGEASAAPEARENLAGLLNLLGPHRGPDSVALVFSR
jgi:general secretion pathway protein N